MSAARIEFDGALPASLPAGAVSAVCCRGRCLTPDGRPARGSLALIADGIRHPVDVLPSGEFFATLVLRAGARAQRLELTAAFSGGGGPEHVVVLGGVEVVPPTAPPVGVPDVGPDTIAVCMATFEPDLDLFRAQVESLRAQADRRWVCLISDDCSSPERFAEVEAIVSEDARFAVSRSDRRLGFYRNFERALTMLPAGARLVALCDQDDRWHPQKLAVLRASLGGAALVYSDQRLVSADGRVLRETLWKGRANNHKNLTSLLIANTITGAATLMRREVVQLALPFPESPGYQFHDHWIGLAALAAGDMAYVSEPLYDYVQHRGAVFGDVTHGPSRRHPGGRRPRRHAPRRRQHQHARLERWRAAYVYGFLSREVQARTLLARCDDRLPAGKRRALTRFADAEHSPLAFASLLTRTLRCLVGRTETLGSELELARGILWRWLAALPLPAFRRPAPPPPLDAFSQERLRRWRAAV